MKEEILEYLKYKPEGMSPTNLGMAMGFDYKKASARMTKPLEQLVKEKWITKIVTGRKVIYKYGRA